MAKEKAVKKEVKKVEKVVVSEESNAKVALKALIAAYKESNPTKYEAKKEALEAKLKSL